MWLRWPYHHDHIIYAYFDCITCIPKQNNNDKSKFTSKYSLHPLTTECCMRILERGKISFFSYPFRWNLEYSRLSLSVFFVCFFLSFLSLVAAILVKSPCLKKICLCVNENIQIICRHFSKNQAELVYYRNAYFCI